MISKIKKYFKEKFQLYNLREKCVELYGENFGSIYDNMNKGVPVGTMLETIVYIKMIEDAKNECVK